MKKLLMWAVGVPFMVIGMAMVTFGTGGGSAWAEAAVTQVSTSH